MPFFKPKMNGFFFSESSSTVVTFDIYIFIIIRIVHCTLHTQIYALLLFRFKYLKFWIIFPLKFWKMLIYVHRPMHIVQRPTHLNNSIISYAKFNMTSHLNCKFSFFFFSSFTQGKSNEKKKI